MRIISKFHDYYDGGAAFGVDMTTVYTRQTEQINPFPQYLRELIDKFPDPHRHNEPSYYANLLFFAGKTYFFLRKEDFHIPRAPDEFMWNMDQMADDWEARRKANKTKTAPWRNDAYSWGDRLNWSPAGIREAKKLADQTDSTEILQRYNVPILRVEGDRKPQGWVNPNLKKLKFQKVLDPFQAFQQIDMFVSGVLPQAGREMVEVSDKVRAEKHGMDEWSFRKKVR